MSFGIDVVILGTIACCCVVAIYLFCKNRVEETDGKLAVFASAITASILLASYVIMARVLDSLIGIYW